MDKNIFDSEHPEKWYLLIEPTPDGNVVRAAGSLEHCQKYDTVDGKRYIINYLSAKFFGV